MNQFVLNLHGSVCVLLNLDEILQCFCSIRNQAETLNMSGSRTHGPSMHENHAGIHLVLFTLTLASAITQLLEQF